MAKRKPANRPPPPPSSAASPFDGDESSLVVMGRIVAPFGIQGWVKVKTYTEDAYGLEAYQEWVVRTPEGWRYLPLEEFAVRPNGTAAKLAGCDDRNAAERLRNAEVAIPREAFDEAEEGTQYEVDLIGLEVVDEGGERLGIVDGFFATGGSSVMVVKGGKERLIPFVPAYVLSVDREAGRIVVDWKAEYDA